MAINPNPTTFPTTAYLPGAQPVQISQDPIGMLGTGDKAQQIYLGGEGNYYRTAPGSPGALAAQMLNQQELNQFITQQQQAAAAAQGQAGAGGAGTGRAGSSYWGPGGWGGGGNMAGGIYINQGGSPYLMKADGTPTTAAQTQEIMRLYQAYEGGDMKAGMAASQWGQALGINLDAAVTDLRQGTGQNAPPTIGATTQPESMALGQMAQIDPASEALRQQLAGSYLGPLAQGTGPPSAAAIQSYLDTYGQVDPSGL